MNATSGSAASVASAGARVEQGTAPATMTVWRQDRYGGPEVVRPVTTGIPELGPREVLVRLVAVSLNSADVRIMRGNPGLIRLGFGLRRPRSSVQGRDVSGVVHAVGAEVNEVAVGDRVVGELNGGGLGEYAVAKAEQLVAVPEGVSHRMAAALPLAGGTAWQALERGGVSNGSRVLVLGAGGGVGMACVRLAVLRGARVHALCSEAALAAVTAQAPDRVDDRCLDLSTLPAQSYDVIIVLGGRAPLSALRRLLVAPGCIVGVAGGEHRVFGPLGRMLIGGVSSIGRPRKFRSLFAVPRPELTKNLLALVASGELIPVISQQYSFAKAGEALARVDRGSIVGKVLVDFERTP